LTNQIFTTKIPQCSEILYYIHQTLLLRVLGVWERDYSRGCGGIEADASQLRILE